MHNCGLITVPIGSAYCGQVALLIAKSSSNLIPEYVTSPFDEGARFCIILTKKFSRASRFSWATVLSGSAFMASQPSWYLPFVLRMLPTGFATLCKGRNQTIRLHGGLHSKEVALLLLNLQPRVIFSAFLNIYFEVGEIY